MTQPVQEPSQGRTDQAQEWRTRQLFRRPSAPPGPPGPGGAANISAIGSAGQRSQTCAGTLDIEFNFIWANDPSFGYTQTTGSPLRAKYITISQEGFWMAQFQINWDTDFTAGDFPYIEPRVWLVTGSTPDNLVNAAAVYWQDGGSIYSEQLTAAESDHHLIEQTVYFNFTAADFGSTVIGIGERINAGGSRTKNFGGQIVLTWLGDTLDSVPIV